MASKHTRVQREFIIRLLAFQYSAAQICERFRFRFSDTACAPEDVCSCDPSYVVLTPDEHAEFCKWVDYAVEKPHSIAPLLDPIKRQIALSHMADDCTSRKAYDNAARYIEQIAKEQAGAYAPKSSGKALGTATTADPVTEIVRRVVDPKVEASA